MFVLKGFSLLIAFSFSMLAFAESDTGRIAEQGESTAVLNDLLARIQKIEDVQEITNLQAQYSYLIDTSQMEALVDLFADEFVWEGGFDQMNGVRSKPELLTLLNNAAEATSMMRHLATTPYIEVDGDRAKGTWYVLGMLTAVTPEGEVAKWVQGRLNNEYVRINGQWKISRKSTQYNFSTPYDESWVKAKSSVSTSLIDVDSDSK